MLCGVMLEVLPMILLALVTSSTCLCFGLVCGEGHSPFLRALFFLPGLLLLLATLVLAFARDRDPRGVGRVT